MKINDKYNRSFIGIHKLIKQDIERRLELFSQIWERGDDMELFYELAFCLFTPQSSAFRSQEAIDILKNGGLGMKAGFEELSDILRIVRFRNNKARYFMEARSRFVSDSPGSLRRELSMLPDAAGKRLWLEGNIRGYGLKEASHFLRNIGFGSDLAILDRHVLRNLVRLKILNEIPASLSRLRYEAIERKMTEYAGISGIPMDHLDFVLWYNETGRIFK